MKKLLWLGDSRKVLRSFPSDAQRKCGFELQKVQEGLPASDSKPMAGVGMGVEEIRIWVESGTYRVIYVARLEEALYVLHAFQKKTQQTSSKDLEVAQSRLKALMRERLKTNL